MSDDSIKATPQDNTDDELDMKKYPSIKYPSHDDTKGLLSDGEVVFIEKIDGANFRFKNTDDGLLYGSRRVLFKENGSPSGPDRINNAFLHTVEYIENTIDTAELDALESEYGELWFYGEAMHKHSIDYDAWEGKEPGTDDEVPNFIGFDVWSVEREDWLSWDEVITAFARLGFRTPSTVCRKPASEVTESDQEIPPSEFRDPDPDADNEFDKQGLAEGVVVRNDDVGVRAKLVHDEFKEKNAVSFNDTAKANSEAGRFVAKYCTDARVQKIAHKIVDDPNSEFDELCMQMMEELPRRVLEDILAEEGWEILNNDIELTEGAKDEIRSKASTKCVRCLKEEMNALV